MGAKKATNFRGQGLLGKAYAKRGGKPQNLCFHHSTKLGEDLVLPLLQFSHWLLELEFNPSVERFVVDPEALQRQLHNTPCAELICAMSSGPEHVAWHTVRYVSGDDAESDKLIELRALSTKFGIRLIELTDADVKERGVELGNCVRAAAALASTRSLPRQAALDLVRTTLTAQGQLLLGALLDAGLEAGHDREVVRSAIYLLIQRGELESNFKTQPLHERKTWLVRRV